MIDLAYVSTWTEFARPLTCEYMERVNSVLDPSYVSNWTEFTL